jgi:hypothetical protein
MKPQNQQIKLKVIENIRKDMADFGLSEYDLKDRISIKLDTEQFNADVDESVWKQKKELIPFVCEVYFDNVWMCDLYETHTHSMLKLNFLKGFERAYSNDKIRLNRLLGVQLDEMERTARAMARKELKDKIEALPESTPEEKASKDIIKEIAKDEDAQIPTNENA